jgi:hypothetical protein
MKDDQTEMRLFITLVCIGFVGAVIRVWFSNEPGGTSEALFAPLFADVLLYFGALGCAGLAGVFILGYEGRERVHSWVFVAGIVGAAILFLAGI